MRRTELANLHAVIIDEFSFIKADMLYLLDLRLREVKQQSDKLFGGVSVFLFGDILQLRPVKARYIFEEPTSDKFMLSFSMQSLWELFDVILLRQNHRQGEDKTYADILNRIRTAEFTEDDIKELESRVFSSNDPRIPPDAPVITCTNAEVNRINADKLDLVNGKEFVIDSVNKNSTQKDFQPRMDTSGAVKGTPLQKQLRIKNGAKVMLTYNVDTADCLTNGAFGEIVGFEFGANESIRLIYVHFHNNEVGKERRRNNIEIQKKFPDKNVVGIERLEFSYSLSKKANGSSSAVAFQFPLRLAFASTAHKVQGLTVKKPTPLIVDLRSVRESAQAYVILSRVQSKEQLYILESLCPEKITSSSLAIELK